MAEECGEVTIGIVGLYWGYIGIMENQMETTIMENPMETTGFIVPLK